jgi:hypothetical protein
VPQIFRPRANAIARWVLLLAATGTVLAIVGATSFVRSSFYTGTGRPMVQPVPFSHEHHVGGLGIDCRYCHNSVETSAFAGLPATEICMTCHSQLWTNAGILAPIRESLARGEPIHWQRVNTLPDYVYFSHAIHVNKGIGCVTCHGPIDKMPLTWRENPMQMSWCLGCHRNPAPNLRPKAAVFDPEWHPSGDLEAMHQALLATYGIKTERMTDCYVCHR